MKEKFLSLVGFSLQRDDLRTEVISGVTTFFTMVYILALLPAMFAPLGAKGFPVESMFTATALSAVVGTLLMAFVAKRPFGLAPGLTLNVFFIETVCLSLGYPWQFALTAVLVEGILFVLICISSLRRIIFEMVPTSLKYAIAAGIGFFVAMIGFKNSGILADGTIFNHLDTIATPSSMLFLLGLILTGTFFAMRFRGSLLPSIIIISLIGIPFGVTQIPDNIFCLPPSPAPLFCQFSFDFIFWPDFWVCVLTMLFFDVFDSLGTVVGVMACSGIIRKDGRIPHLRRIMLSDAIATITGACLGCSTVTTYVESATGFAEGGRTGLSALVVAICDCASSNSPFSIISSTRALILLYNISRSLFRPILTIRKGRAFLSCYPVNFLLLGALKKRIRNIDQLGEGIDTILCCGHFSIAVGSMYKSSAGL